MRVCDGKLSGQRSKHSKRRLKDRLCFRPAYRDARRSHLEIQIGTRSSGTMMTSQGNIARSLNYRKDKLSFQDVSAEVREKVLWKNAAGIYRL